MKTKSFVFISSQSVAPPKFNLTQAIIRADQMKTDVKKDLWIVASWSWLISDYFTYMQIINYSKYYDLYRIVKSIEFFKCKYKRDKAHKFSISFDA